MMHTNGYTRGQPDAAWWLEQIRSGIEWRKKMTKEVDWSRWRKYYRGEFPRGILPVNLFFRMRRSIVPQLYFRNPSISVTAGKPGLEQQMFAQLIERIDNKLIRTMNTKYAMKRAIDTTWMFGTGALKLGFGAQFTPTPEIFNTEAPEEFRSSITRKVEYNSQVSPNMPWVASIHPGNLIVPRGLMNFEDTPWVAEWIRRPVDDVQSDPRFKHVKDIKSTTNKGLGSMAQTGMQAKKDEVDLIEIRDMRTTKVMVIAPYASDRVLFYDDDYLQNNNRPNIYPFSFNPDDEVFWGVPDSVILEPQQNEINEIRTLMMKHRRISILKLLYTQGAIDDGEIEKLLDGDVLSAVRVKDLQGIERFELGQIPETLFAADQTIQGDVRDGMGFSRNQAGEFQSNKSHNAPTAREVMAVQQAASIRIDERRDIIADVLVDIFEDANELIFDKWQEEQIVQVMGPDSLPLWVKFKPNMLKAAKYELLIDPDSTVPETKDVRMNKAVQSYGLLKDNPLIDPQGLTAMLLRELHGVEYDNLMRGVAMQAGGAGAPGSTQGNPMSPDQLMQQIMSAAQRGGAPSTNKPPTAG